MELSTTDSLINAVDYVAMKQDDKKGGSEHVACKEVSNITVVEGVNGPQNSGRMILSEAPQVCRFEFMNYDGAMTSNGHVSMRDTILDFTHVNSHYPTNKVHKEKLLLYPATGHQEGGLVVKISEEPSTIQGTVSMHAGIHADVATIKKGGVSQRTWTRRVRISTPSQGPIKGGNRCLDESDLSVRENPEVYGKKGR